MSDSVARFSNRAENYARFRPSYPAGVIKVLETHCGLTKRSMIADVGSGTGILSKLFLNNGNAVIGIEPNPEMRRAGERILGGFPNFTSTDATAEATTLEPCS